MSNPQFLANTLSVPALVSSASDGTAGDHASGNANVSADGHYALFESMATNLVSSDTNGFQDIFEKDLWTGTTIRISTNAQGEQSAGNAEYARFGASDTQVVFDSNAPDLITPTPHASHFEVYVKDLVSGKVTLASATPTGTEGNADSQHGVVSPDGNRVAFQSLATNLIGADTNNASDVYIKDLVSGQVVRASTTASGGEANGQSADVAWSPDGQSVVFDSNASNLVAGDTNGAYDIFVKNLTTGAIIRVSTAANGAQANGHSLNASFTPDGVSVVFESTATNLVPGGTTGGREVFEKNLTTGAVTLLSTGVAGEANGPSFHAVNGGQFTAFESFGSNLSNGAALGHRDVFVGSSAGVALRALGADGAALNADSLYPALSADGATLVFQSSATNAVSGVTNGFENVYAEHLRPTVATGAVTANGAATSGRLLFSDADPNATHSVSIVAPEGAIGVFTATLAADTTHGQVGAIDWHMGSEGLGSLAPGQMRTETFTVNVTDASGNTASEAVTLTLTGSALPVIANPDVVTVNASATTGDLRGTLLANDTIPAGDHVTITAVDASGTLGSVAIDPMTGAVTYTAGLSAYYGLTQGQSAADHFAYTIHDANTGATSTAQVNVTVNGIASPSATDGADTLIAAPGGSTLNGGAGNDTLIGNGGHDVLIGGTGADTLIAGTGDTVFSVDNTGDRVSAPANGGHDIVVSTIDYALPANVQDLVLVGGDVNGTGNALANHIAGTDGNNVLDGGVGGADVLAGGNGNDTYIVNNPGDQVIEQAAAGNDTILTALPSYILPANVENLAYSGTGAFTGVGNDLGDVIQGGPSNNALTGGAGNDRITGGAGNDTIDGGAGADILWGGAGANTFVEHKGEAQGDLIGDFNTHGAGDKIELTGWGAGTTLTATGSGQYTIHDGVDGHVEVLTIVGPVHPADVMFG